MKTAAPIMLTAMTTTTTATTNTVTTTTRVIGVADLNYKKKKPISLFHNSFVF